MNCPYCGHSLTDQDIACPQCGSALSEPRLQIGTLLLNGRYTVGSVLGQGGFGITYQGADTQLRRVVAIKELFPDGSSRRGAQVIAAGSLGLNGFAAAKGGFLAEARTLAQFDHPGIVHVRDIFEENGTAYLVMEKLVGETLGEKLTRESKLPALEVERIMFNLAEALGTVHTAGLLHRDLKPDNIFITSDSRAVLIDFGSAREFATAHTVKHTRLLTPGYAPLEQYAEQARFGPYTDIYALGATLYHMLVGRPPPAVTDRMMGIALEPLPSGTPAGLRQGIEQSLELHIDKRPQNVHDFTDLARNLVTLGLHPTVRNLNAFIGQDAIKRELRISIQKQHIPHMLFIGSDESGRRTLAQALAAELGVGIVMRHASHLKTPSDLAAVLQNFRQGGVLFIDEIHQLSQLISERLYSLTKGAKLDLVSGTGIDMHWTQMEVAKFVLCASSKHPNLIHKTLRSSLEVTFQLNAYSHQELSKLLLLESKTQSLKLLDDAALEIAQRSRGQWKIAKQHLSRITQFAQQHHASNITRSWTISGFEEMNVDNLGLEKDDLQLLEKLLTDFNGSANLNTLACEMGKEAHEIIDIHEPYLVQIGFVSVSKGIWTLQDAARNHLKTQVEFEF